MARPTTILITGASAGIGKATAELLAKTPGTRLILTGRRADKLCEVAAALPCETHLLTFDVREREAALAAIRSLPKEWQPIDVLVNNAGLALSLTPFAETDFTDWEVMVETNIMGLLTLTREVLPGMLARGRGHIVNLSSTAGSYHYAGGHVYGATKAFVTHLSMMLRADLLGSPVRVTDIAPGMVETDFSLVRFKGNEAEAAKVYANANPLTPEDIAEAIRWSIAAPAHMNVNRIEIMPTSQAPAGLAVHRKI